MAFAEKVGVPMGPSPDTLFANLCLYQFSYLGTHV